MLDNRRNGVPTKFPRSSKAMITFIEPLGLRRTRRVVSYSDRLIKTPVLHIHLQFLKVLQMRDSVPVFIFDSVTPCVFIYVTCTLSTFID